MDNGPTEQLNYEEMYKKLKAEHDETVASLRNFLLIGLVHLSLLLGIAIACVDDFDPERYYEYQDEATELL